MRLSKDLTTVAAQALMSNLTRLGPLILPPSEKIAFAINMIREKIYGRDPKNPYVPQFKKAVQHVCIHSGGRAVIDSMQRALQLSDADTEPSRATLYKWGNVSSCSVWYVLAFIESFKGLGAGEKVRAVSVCAPLLWHAL